MVRDREYLLRHEEFPRFEDARLAEIFDVQLVSEKHLLWPALDVDLHLDSLAEPARFPLVSRVAPRPSRRSRR